MKLVLELEGGPPWGFRTAKRNSDEAVFVSQVVTGGKASLAGMKIGDVLENVQHLNRRPTFEEVQLVLAEANSIYMQLSRVNFEEEQDQNNDPLNVPIIDENEEPKGAGKALVNQTPNVPRMENNNYKGMSKSMVENYQQQHYHHIGFPTSIFSGVQAQLAAEKGEHRSQHSYSGGFCGTARDKRRFFEQAAAQQIEKPPPTLHRHHKGMLGSQTLCTPSPQILRGSDCWQPVEQTKQSEHHQQKQQQVAEAITPRLGASTPGLIDFVNSFALDRASEDIIKDVIVQVPESQTASRHIFMAAKPTQPQQPVADEPTLSIAQLCAKIGSQLVLKPKGMATGSGSKSQTAVDNNNYTKPKLGRVLDDPIDEYMPLTIANNAFKFRSTNCNDNFCYQYPTTDDESTTQQSTKVQLLNARKESSEQSIDTGFGSADSEARLSLPGNSILPNTAHPASIPPAAASLGDDNSPDLINLSCSPTLHPANNSVQHAAIPQPSPFSPNQLTRSTKSEEKEQANGCFAPFVNTTFANTPTPAAASLTQQAVFDKSKEVADLQDLTQTLKILTENVEEKKQPDRSVELKMLLNHSLLLQAPLNLGATALTPEQHSSTLSSSSTSPLNGDASASSTSSSMLVAGVSVRLGTTGLEKNYEDRLHPTSTPAAQATESAPPTVAPTRLTDPANKSVWYRQMYKQLHCFEEDNGRDESVLTYQQQKEQPKMYGRRYQRPTTPNWRLESGQRNLAAASSNWAQVSAVRRSRSQPRQQQQQQQQPYRYDPVADMEILDRWKLQQQQQNNHSISGHPLNNVPKPKSVSTATQFEEDYNGGSERSTASNLMNGFNSSREEGSVTSAPSKDSLLQKQRIDKLCEELEDQLARKHGYLPCSIPSLQNNFDRFDHLMHSFKGDHNGSRSGSATPLSRSNSSSRPVQTCTLLYSFVGEGPRELSLNKGDVVRLHRELDDNWWEGERNGQVGIFPASYAQLDECTSKDRLKAIFAFRARNPNELNLNRGDTLECLRAIDQHWLEGRNSKGQVGIFPKSYVQQHQRQEEVNKRADKRSRSTITFAGDGLLGTPDRPKTPKIIAGNGNGVGSPSRTAKTSSVAIVDEAPAWQALPPTNVGSAQPAPPSQPIAPLAASSAPALFVPRNAETYRALYPYKPEHSDELALVEDDIVFVVEKCDDGWFIGKLLRTGQFGTFPGNYVVKH